MARPTISRQIDSYTVIASPGQAGATNLITRDSNFPSGDQLLRSLLVRYDATVSGTSTPTRVTNGHRALLKALTVETDKHGKIVDGVDGLLMYAMLAYDAKQNGYDNAMTSTPADSDTPGMALNIPLTLRRGINPYDTNLDMLKAVMKVSTQYGPVTQLWTQSGGTPLIASLVQGIEAKILPGPVQTDPASSELPMMLRSWSQQVVPISATAARYQIQIPFGDRIYRRIFITQRNTSSGVEMSNVIATTAEISLYINNVPVVDRRQFRMIQAENQDVYGITPHTGVAVLDFDADEQERINDMLKLITKDSGNAYLYVDVTSQSNGSVLLGFDCLKPIPDAALR